ncbi:unnamed protein product [marine sediment metagenome]|uniref:DUF4015 domain-containing protein n=1 Tax=marine sediment metagenome TaxID=412755 RepID=X1LAG9_9ZZZZ
MRVTEFYIAFFLVLVVLIVGIVLVFFQKPVSEVNPSEPLPSSSEILPGLEKQLAQSPETIKAIYLTSWSVSKKKMIDYLIDIAKTTEINAVVIDIKDFSGYIAYDTDVSEVEKYGAEQIRISELEGRGSEGLTSETGF